MAGVFGFNQGRKPYAADVGFSRGGTGTFMKLGNGTAGDSTGRFDLATLNASGVATAATVAATTSLKLTAKTFATLNAAPVDGEIQFCSDCKVTTTSTCSAATPGSCVCTGSGTVVFAMRMNYAGGGDNW
jgi:hypothetical protein